MAKINLVLAANQGYPTSNTGGSNKIIYEILKSLDYHNFKPTYFSYRAIKTYQNKNQLIQDQSNLVSTTQKAGHTLFQLSSTYRKLVLNRYYQRFYIFKKTMYCNRFLSQLPKNTLIHSHDVGIHYLLSKNSNIKKILTIHSKGSMASELQENKRIGAAELRKIKIQELSAYMKSDIITFPSLSAKNIFEKDVKEVENNSRQKDIRIIYNGIDFKFIQNIENDNMIFENVGIQAHKKFDIKIFNVSEHVSLKRLNILIDTIDYLKRRYSLNPLLINCGEGPKTSELRDQIQDKKLDQNVFLLGKIDNHQIIKLMKVMDFFIMTSIKVIFDMVILEALASGICVIANANGGNLEIIEDGINGYLIEEMTHETIANLVKKVNPYKTRENAIITASSFTNYKMTEKYQEIYSEILNRK